MRALGVSLALAAAWTAAASPAQTEPNAPRSTPVAAEAPMSSIDWLSDSIAGMRPERRAPSGGGAVPAPVTVRPLDAPFAGGVGLAAPEETGLAPGLWGAGQAGDIARRLAALPERPLPAARDALKTLITARLDPPAGDAAAQEALLLARIDAALRLGALEEAAALIEAAGTGRPELFRRAFDIALLQGTEDEGCAALAAAPGIAPSIAVRIFCLARSGDWAAAALTLETAEALGQLDPMEDALLARFLDAELAEGVPPLPRFPAPTPLEWRMLEAIGERQPTAGLPLAFAHADLRGTAGWKARIEATERLARAGALPPGRLVTTYTERAPAASGGVWERVAAVQALVAALDASRGNAAAQALQAAWAEMRAAGLGVAFAEAMAPRLAGRALGPEGARLAHRIALLAPDYESAALAPPEGADPVARALARGMPPARAPADPLGRAVAAAFAVPAPPLPRRLTRLRTEDRRGEALLEALSIVAAGAQADPADLTGALAYLRAEGMEDTARRAALQLTLLEGAA